MNKKELTRRYLFFLLGLFVNSFGVSFVTKANLGTSPISSIPYTLSLGFAPSLGTFTLYMSLVLIVIQIILLRKEFPKHYLLQIPVSFLFSYFIDFTMNLLNDMAPHSYGMKLISLLLGCLILGIGVFMEMAANVVMLPGESFVNAVSKTFHTDFGKTKVVFDSAMTICAGIIGIILFHKLEGVREGTVIAAVLVGMIARLLKRKIGFIEDKWLIISQDDCLNYGNVEYNEQRPEYNNVTMNEEYGNGDIKLTEKMGEGEVCSKLKDEEMVVHAENEIDSDKKTVVKEKQTFTNSLGHTAV